MYRSKRIIIVAHCILNVNSKVKGLALYQGALKETVMKYIDEGIGIIQLPCPELTFIGLQRWGMAKNQYNTPNYRKHCRNLVLPYIDQILDYIKNGYSIEGIIGIDGSPSCGVNYVSAGYHGGIVDSGNNQENTLYDEPGKGILIEEIYALLSQNNIDIKLLSVDEKSPK